MDENISTGYLIPLEEWQKDITDKEVDIICDSFLFIDEPVVTPHSKVDLMLLIVKLYNKLAEAENEVPKDPNPMEQR